MTSKKILAILKKNTMLVVLVLVYVFFMITTQGSIFKPMNFNAIRQVVLKFSLFPRKSGM